VDDAHTQVFVVYFADLRPTGRRRRRPPWEYFPIRDEKGEYR
jgi:hypothetical protein